MELNTYVFIHLCFEEGLCLFIGVCFDDCVHGYGSDRGILCVSSTSQTGGECLLDMCSLGSWTLLSLLYHFLLL